MFRRQTTPRLLRALCALLMTFSVQHSAEAQAQTDLTTPTQWAYLTGANLAQVNQQINQGYRIVDLEVLDDSPLSFTATFVRNTGDYAKGWWWYFNLTPADVNAQLAQNNARLIDIQPYNTANGLRYAAVMISNTGADAASGHGWNTGLTSSQMFAEIAANPTRRVIDVQIWEFLGFTTYTYVWVANTGNMQSAWWYLLNASSADVANTIQQTGGRLIDMERHSNGRYSVVLTPTGGRYWWYFFGLSTASLTELTEQYAARAIDIETRVTLFGFRHDAILVQNADPLTVEANSAMRQGLPTNVKSGLLLQRLDSPGGVLASVNAFEPFEPASSIKLAHHYTAMRRVATGQDFLTANVSEATGLNGSCPTGTGPTTRSLNNVLRSMMESSSNTATLAVAQRYGTGLIESTAFSVGALGVDLNHVLGCGCNPATANAMRLYDGAQIHRAVVNGSLGSYTDEFRSLMLNSREFGSGGYSTSSLRASLLNASSLNATERTVFSNAEAFAHKGGSYNCPSGSRYFRSVGVYLQVPFRDGCEIEMREYYLGAFVDEAPGGASAEAALGAGVHALYGSLLQEALASWVNETCVPENNYCTAFPNSTGVTGLASASGSTYLAYNNLVLRGTRFPTSTFGYLMVSDAPGYVTFPAGSAGSLCLGGSNIGRYSLGVQSTGSTGTMSQAVNSRQLPQPNGTAMAESGEHWYFQWWHRDSSGSGTPTSNFSNGLRITFQ